MRGLKFYHCHDLTYASNLIRCGHCGRPITGESIVKKTQSGERVHVYYGCSQYNMPDHQQVRLTEADLDQQMLRLFDCIRIKDEKIREWFLKVLRGKIRAGQEQGKARRADLQRQETSVKNQWNELLNLRLINEIERDTYQRKDTGLRDRLAMLKLQIDACDRRDDEEAELAVKAFELSQQLAQKYVGADCEVKRRLVAIACLNQTLDGATLSPTTRKPFDALAEGLSLTDGSGGRI